MRQNGLQIAIDGGAATGKSTTGKQLAKLLHYTYCDTGAMYRCATLKALRHGLDVHNNALLTDMLTQTKIRFTRGHGVMYVQHGKKITEKPADPRQQVILDGQNVTSAIRSQKVTDNSSAVAAQPGVRKILTRLQQKLADKGGIVMDGRDIGTTVMPKAEIKIFMTSELKKRAERRLKDDQKLGVKATVPELEHKLSQRDYKDSHRSVSPLKKASDAIVLDTTRQTVLESAQVIARIVACYIIKHADYDQRLADLIRNLAN